MLGAMLIQKILSAALCAATLLGLPVREVLYFQGVGTNMVEDFGTEALNYNNKMTMDGMLDANSPS